MRSILPQAGQQRLLATLPTAVLCVLAALAATCAFGDEPEKAGQPEAKPAQAAEEQPRLGRFIRVASPITDKLDNRIRLLVDATLKEAHKLNHWPVFIFEIQPGRTEIGQALDLARYLSSSALDGATTVAFIPESISGHDVLVAMACDEIIMREDAEIGEAGKYEVAIEPWVRDAYVEIANRRKTIPADLALGMLDPAVEVLLVETDTSRELVLASRLAELRKQKSFETSKVIKPAGQPGNFTGQQGRELGFVSYLAADREAVAKIWKLPRETIVDDPGLAGDWRPVRVDVKGPIDEKQVERLQKTIEVQIREHDANFLCLWIDSAGGSPADSLNLANFLAGQDSSKRRTVAYIPREARGDAAFVALACDQIIMHAGATLGGSGAVPLSADDARLAASSLEDIARRKFRAPALVAALVDPSREVFRCVRKTDGLVNYFSKAELVAQGDAAQWRVDKPINTPGQPLRLDGNAADELGLASGVVTDFTDFKALYGLEDDPQLVEPGWATTLIDALNTPGVSWFLLFLGAAALYAELQAPGIGVGALVGSLCFLLYFWSAYLGGTAGWLEALLFLAGIVCLMLEVFVFPGTALFGLVGGLLVVVSVVLASQTFVFPRNEYQFEQLRTSLSVLVGAAVAALAAAIAMNKYLPHTPMFKRMLLVPPSREELSHIARRESLAEFAHLVGQQGVATTPLLPAGKARFGEQIVDVIADAQFIDRGQSVVVIQARGNRVLVRIAT